MSMKDGVDDSSIQFSKLFLAIWDTKWDDDEYEFEL